MSEKEQEFVDVDEKTEMEEEESPHAEGVRSASRRRKIRCAYCKTVFPTFVQVRKHLKVCPANPHNP